MSIYEEATNSLYEDANECFDCDPEQAWRPWNGIWMGQQVGHPVDPKQV
jgi:hypothetical protein